MIKVVTFDLDGVYFPNGKANFISMLKSQFNIDEERVKMFFLKSPQMNQEYKNGKMTDEEFWSWAIKMWGINIPWQDVVRMMIEEYDVDENVVATVKLLKQRGYKTAICSNNFPARVNGLQEKFSFLDNFDIRVFSYEVGVSKPDKKIFEALVDKAGVEPASIIFADDNSDNLAGAKEVGITTFLYEGFERYLEQLKGVGVNV